MSAPEIVAVLAGTAVLLMTFAVAQLSRQAALDGRLRTFVRRESPGVPMTVRRPRKESRVAWVEALNKRLRRANFARRLQQDLIRAGIHLPASRFIIFQGILMSVAFLAVSRALNSVRDLEGLPSLALSLGAAGAAWYIPLAAVRFKEAHRLKTFERQLPPTIDAMAGALQAGSSLPQAMEMVSREMAPPIAEELGIVVREMTVGVPMQEAFGNMLQRVHSLDLDMLVTAITIQHRVGGNLSQILRTISHTVRERLRIKGEIAILTAQQRLAAIIVSALPLIIILALFFIAPDYIMKLFQPGIARLLLVMGGLGILAGFYALRRIADIDV